MINVYVVIIVILAIALIFSIFGNINLLRKYENAETAFESSEQSREEMELWITTFSNQLIEIDKGIHEIDRKGSFDSDDEIGFFFKEIKKMNEELKQFIQN